jgi:hypothetical protein
MTSDNCIKQIEALAKNVALLTEQNNELHATNQQLLRQHEAQKTTLIIVTETLKRAGLPLLNIKPATVETSANDIKTTFQKRGYKSLDGNTPFKMLSNQLAAEQRI